MVNIFLIIIGYYLKYPETFNLYNDLTATNVIKNGIPCTVMSDSGRQFTSLEFKEFANTHRAYH